MTTGKISRFIAFLNRTEI